MRRAAAELLPRRAHRVLNSSLAAFRVVVLHGARQTGKTTLARVVADEVGAPFVTLDSPDNLASARDDAPTFLAVSGRPLVLDEIQRVGQPLVLAIKMAVDSSRQPGQFLLTGSTNFLTVPTISETLAGRVDIVNLWPLSIGEQTAGADDFVDRAFGSPDSLVRAKATPWGRGAYFEAVCRGGFPEVQSFEPHDRRRWFSTYVRTVIQREVEAAADIRQAGALTAMVRLLAAQTSQELVLSRLGERLGIDRATVARYEPWLETVFLVHRTPAWSRNLSAKVVRRPKLYMTDTGLAASLVGKDAVALARPQEPAAGPLVETLVVNELSKQLTWCRTAAALHHLRDSDGREVDLILEADDGRVVAIEVKATNTPRRDDFRWLEFLRDRLDRVGEDFVCGVVLHTGTRRLSFGDRLVALPISDVWSDPSAG